VSAPIGPLLDGRVAIVTGGGAGIGRGISEAFVAHGAHVVVVDSDPARASTVEGAYGIHADVREPGAAERIAAETVDVFGPADVLVNNVGMYLMGGKRFWDTTEADWQAMYDVNLLHVFRMSRAVLGSMVERRRGSIITVSTVEAFRGIPGQPIYGAFKAGVAHFTKCLAVDVAGEGVRVNDIAPDVTVTPQLPYDRWLSDDEKARVPSWVPVGRLGLPSDHAGVAVFLASDLSEFVTGTSIPVDGGTLAAGGWYPTTHGNSRWTNRPLDA
jgi:NAD(P)-dependent dehydrogenase (short-subunit alcohol dehydrogenase family)